MRIQTQRETFAYRFALEGRPFVTPEDQEWQNHVDRLNAVLGDLYRRGVDTRTMSNRYGTATYKDADGKKKIDSVTYSPERQAMRKKLMEAYLGGLRYGGRRVKGIDEYPQEFQSLLLGGISGGGKGTILENDPRIGIDHNNYMTLDVDELKALATDMGMNPTDEDLPELAGLSPMERTPLIHYEMSDLMDEIVQEALKRGTNVILDKTMASQKSITGLVDSLKRAGYNRAAAFVSNNPTDALAGVTARHKNSQMKWKNEGESPGNMGGRPVPDYISSAQAQVSNPDYLTVNEEVFDTLANTPGAFDNGWIKFDNSFDPNAVDPANPRNQNLNPGDRPFSRARVLGSSNSGIYANAIPQLTAQFRLRRANFLRRKAYDMEPETLFDLVLAYQRGLIDYPTLFQKACEAKLNEEIEEVVEDAHDLGMAQEWFEAEGLPSHNSNKWIHFARNSGDLSNEQAEALLEALDEIENLVGAQAAALEEGAASSDAAPAPTPDMDWMI